MKRFVTPIPGAANGTPYKRKKRQKGLKIVFLIAEVKKEAKVTIIKRNGSDVFHRPQY